MELIDRYLNEVGRHLPPKSREDILAELRSLLQDKLDERSVEGQPSKADVIAVLKAMGAPKKVAASYAGERHLIGPGLYPLFMQILRIGMVGLLALPILTLCQLLSVEINSFGDAVDVGFDAVGTYIETLIHFFGILVLVFAGLEWLDVRVPQTEETWDPEKLPPVDRAGKVDWFEMSIEMAVNFVALSALAYFYQKGGIPFSEAPDGLIAVTPAIWIGLMIATALEIGVRLVVLYNGTWRVPTALSSMLFELAGAFFGLMVMQEAVPVLADVLGVPELLQLPQIIFGVCVIIILIDSGTRIFRLISRRGLGTPAMPAAAKR